MSQASVKAAVTARETDLGRRYNIDDHNYAWSTYFPTWAETWDIQNGRIPMISWDAGDAGSIAAGANDSMIAARADAVKGLGKNVFINLFPQMNLQGWKGTPAEFAAAYRKVVTIFNNRAANNAVFVWCPSSEAFANGSAGSFYPGDTYVDWLCAEGFNWAPGRSGSTWTSFWNIFNPFYKWGIGKPKPMMIASTGVQERNAGEKATWINAMSSSLKNSFPNIQAIVYNDAQQGYDWRPNTSSGAYTAYKNMAADSYYKPYSSTSPPTSTSGTLLGTYVKPETGWQAADFQNAFTNLITRTGSNIDIGHQYIAWKGSLGGWQSKFHLNNGRIPMISWASAKTTEINTGAHDAWIRQQADAVKALGKPVMIRYLWEMDLLKEESISPADFIAAWRRIHTIFQNRGATNARWVWCPSAHSFNSGIGPTWYPGDEYVDWIGADGYNWGSQAEPNKWRPFRDVFANFYTWAAARNKPLMIGETGSQERWAGEKGQWYLDMASTIKTTYPKIKALVMFDAYASSFGGGMFHWELDTTWSSFDAWKKIAADPYFTSSHDI
jgi:beta-mannanase